MYYIIRPVNHGHQIAKFSPDYNEPLDVYPVSLTDCGCASYNKPCKHCKMLEKWLTLSNEERIGQAFDEDTQEFLKVLDLCQIKDLVSEVQ